MPSEPENLSPEAGGPLLPEEIPSPQDSVPVLAPRQIWRTRDLILFIAFIPFALLASKFVVLVGYVVVRPLAGWHAKADAAQADILFLLVQQFVFYAFILGFLLMFAKIYYRQPFWKSLGWRLPTERQVAGYLAAGGGLAVAVSLALAMRPDAQGFPLEQLFNSPAACYAIGAFAVAVAPVVEELVFRGFLFAILERTVGIRLAVVTTAVLFAGLHVPEYWPAWNHILMILAVGMVFSLARGITGSLTPSIILHIGYNSLMVIGLFFSTQHFRTVTSIWMA